MDEFNIYFYIGFTHIVDFAGIDHILFIAVLAAVYQFSQWRKVLVLITAFTLGHSLTLALATYRVIDFNQNLIELIIPITIFITALLNFYDKSNKTFSRNTNLKYILAVFFGLIHGLAFSNFLREALMSDNIVFFLFAFNLGLEAGQILVVLILLLLSTLAIQTYKIINLKSWNYTLSGISALASIVIFAVKLLK